MAVEPTVKVSTELPVPGAAIGLTLKDAVTPAGSPVATSVTAELNVPLALTFTVEIDDVPCAAEMLLGDAQI